MSSITTEDKTYDPGLRSGTLLHLNFVVVPHNVTANLAEFQSGLQSVRVLCEAISDAFQCQILLGECRQTRLIG
jgi:hypothetical protein